MKKPVEMLLDHFHQLQDELCKVDTKALRENAPALREELEGLTRAFQGRLKTRGGAKSSDR